MIGTHQANRLRSIVMANLRPPKFPPRRDLELAAESQSNAQFVAFSDYFWLVDGRLAIVAARLQGRGVALALQAGALRQLLRATLTEFHEPGPALTTAQAYFSGLNLVGVDIAVLLTDPKSGRQESAGLGEWFAGELQHDLSGHVSRHSDSLRPFGKLFWTVAGPIRLPAVDVMPILGPSALVSTAIKRATKAAAVVAVLVKPKLAAAAESATLLLTNELTEVPRVLDELARFCTSQKLPLSITSGLDVALDEVLSNIILYGFRDGAEHQICVDVRISADNLVLDVRDDGIAFDPLKAPEPDLSLDLDHRPIGGLGLHFIRTVLDDVTYRRVDGWNILTMKKHRVSAEAAEAPSSIG